MVNLYFRFSILAQMLLKYSSKDALGLTGMEISINRQPAGTGDPFVHIHQQNEEVYIVVSGTGIFFVNGKELPLTAGSLIRVAPGAERSLSAGSEEDLCYICVREFGTIHHERCKAGPDKDLLD